MPLLDLTPPDPNAPRQRSLTITKAEVDAEARTVAMSVSSDTDQVITWVKGKGWGRELLDHTSLDNIDLSRFAGENGGPLLFNHDRSCIVGRFTPKEVRDGKLYGTGRFGNSEDAQEVFQDVQDQILTDTSCYYDYDEADVALVATGEPDDYPTYRVLRWQLIEASVVPVPADHSVGIGRSARTTPTGHTSGHSTQEVGMPDIITPAAPQAANTPDPRQERIEAMQLRNMANKLGLGAQADEILGSDKTLGEARAAIMELVGRQEAQPLPAGPKSLQELGASERELKEYSYARLVSAIAERSDGRSFSSLETEISDTLSKSMPMNYTQRGGLFIPFSLRKGRAAMDTQTAGKGKDLVFTQPGPELIEILRNRLTLATLGARFLSGLTGPVAFSKQTGAAVAQWLTENGGTDATESNSATGLVTLTPRTLVGTAAISRQLLQLGSWDSELMVREDLAYAFDAAIDLAAFHGTGTGQPTGLYTLAGVNAVAMGGNPTYASVVNMFTKIAQANASGKGRVGVITNPLAAGKMMSTLKFASAGSQAIWEGTFEEGIVCGYKATSTNQISNTLGAGTNETGMIAGNYSDLIVGLFGNGFEILLDPFAKKKQALVELTSFGMADVVARHAESFTKATGMVIS